MLERTPQKLLVLGPILSNEQDHRLAILHRNMDADGRIRRPRPARDKGDTGPLSQRTISASHERDAAFLSTHHRLNLRHIMERIKHRKEALPRHSENPVAALDNKLIDKHAPASAFDGHNGVTCN